MTGRGSVRAAADTPSPSPSSRSRLEPLWGLAGVYFVHYLLLRASLQAGLALPAARPFRGFPGYLLMGWDGEHYLHLAQRFDAYAWPPLYPLALRGLGALLLVGLSLLVRNMGAYLGAALVAAEVLRAVSQRKLEPRRLLAALAWVPFLAGWNLWLQHVAGTDPVASTLGWQEELLQKHVPPGVNPKLWVARYLMLPGKKEALFSRYTSVLFPLSLMVADGLKRWPPLQGLALALAVALSHHHELVLFMNREGEP